MEKEISQQLQSDYLNSIYIIIGVAEAGGQGGAYAPLPILAE